MSLPEIAAGYLVWSISEAISGESFDTVALKGITDVRAEKTRLTCRLPITQQLVNKKKSLHGGVTSTLIDLVGHAACLTAAKHSGWTLSLTIEYLNPLPLGGTVLIDARVLGVTGSTATVEVFLSDCDTGKLVAYGTHTHYMAEGEDVGYLEKLAAMSPKPLLPPLPSKTHQPGSKL